MQHIVIECTLCTIATFLNVIALLICPLDRVILCARTFFKSTRVKAADLAVRVSERRGLNFIFFFLFYLLINNNEVSLESATTPRGSQNLLGRI